MLFFTGKRSNPKLAVLFFLLGLNLSLQAQLTLDFRNPTIANGGADLQVGTQYRFQNVGVKADGTALDALVTIVAAQAATLSPPFDSDNSFLGTGISDFNPRVNPNNAQLVNGSADGAYVEFRFEIVQNADNNTPEFIPLDVYALDIDGDDAFVREYVSISNFNNYTLNQGTAIVALPNGRFEAGNAVHNNGINAVDTFMARAGFVAASTFTIRTGILRDGGTNDQERWPGIAFQPSSFSNPQSTFIDTDGDGITDNTEFTNGTDLNNPCSPSQGPGYNGYDANNTIWQQADCDGDGIDNITEINDGDPTTDPYCAAITSAQGGSYVNHTFFLNGAAADGLPDGNFTGNISGTTDELILSYPNLNIGDNICLVLGFNDANGILKYSLNGGPAQEITNPAQTIGFAPQTICITVTQAGPQSLSIGENGMGAIQVDGSTYYQCSIADWDGDGVADSLDICNGFDDTLDTDQDGIPDGCDEDDDNDGILDALEENCGPAVAGFDAYWDLDNSTEDRSGNGNNLQNGRFTFAPAAKRGVTAAAFNGVNQYLNYSNGTFLNEASSFFTYALWIKPADLNGIQTIVEQGGSVHGVALRLNNNTLEAAIRENSVQRNTGTFTYPNDNNWHHVAITYNNGILNLYLDGFAAIPVNTGFGELTAHTDSQNFARTNAVDAFGASLGNYFQGSMDEIVHYPIALTQQQIQLLVNTNCNSDTDNIPDALDVDSDNDGCFDALEGDGGFSTTDLDSAGRLLGGIETPSGIPTAANGGQANVSAKDNSTQAAICQDDDNDGVPNDSDLCPNTPQGESVDQNGCAASQSPDTDGDGVNDNQEDQNGTDKNDPCDPAQGPNYVGFDATNTIWRAADCDGDGVTNGAEVTNGTNPYLQSADTDGDGIDDDNEIANGTDQDNPCDPAQNAGYTGFQANNAIWRAADCDGDTLLNGEEADNGTDPYNAVMDTDGDGIQDTTERANGTDPTDPCDPAQAPGYTGYEAGNTVWGAADCDGDGVTNIKEFANGTDPYLNPGDTDGDGIADDLELENNTDPNNACDPAQSANYTGFDSNNAIWAAADCDGDGVTNLAEVTNGTNPYQISADTDGDGIIDDVEINNNTDQTDPCDPAQNAGYTAFDASNSIWAAADCDGDTLLNGDEANNGTDPYTANIPDTDTDGDGITDVQEIADGTDPNDSCDSIGGTPLPTDDCDNDGLTNAEENTGLDDPTTPADPNGQLTDPENPDTDADTITDGQEAIDQTDPNDPCDAVGGTAPLGTDCGLVAVDSDIVAPNKPNGFFNIKNIERFPDNTVNIFNRWGVAIYTAKGYDNTNVVFKGVSNARATLQQTEQLPAGVYYYIIEYQDNGTTATINGYLYINR